MPFPVLGSNSAVAAGYEIDNSLRFNDDDSARLGKDFSSTETSDKTKTLSFWIKRSTLGQEGLIRARADNEDANTRTIISFNSDDRLEVQSRLSGSGATLRTNRVFRDISAWYHLVFAFDTSQASASNRLKIYVNGVEETSFAVDERSSISQNREIQFGNNKSNSQSFIGNEVSDLGFYDGYISEFNFIDGQQLAPTEFGETNDNGVWIPKAYSGSYGTNGFFLEFKNSGALGTDTSGNGNDFTATNLTATDQTTDTPTNNFATMNPLTNSEATFLEGNTEIDHNGSAGRFTVSTFEVNKAKWYFEAKLLNYGGDSRPNIGLGQSTNSFRGILLANNNHVSYLPESSNYQTNGGSSTTVNTSPSSNDIYMFAFDLDNLKFYIGKNNTWYHSSNPSTNTNGLTIAVSDYYGVATGPNNTSSDSAANNDWQFNFGNPPFAISSGNSDANGYGNFEYAVPSGYYALCTKNLAEYG